MATSPLTGGKSRLIKKLSTNLIVNLYKKSYHINPGRFFKGLNYVYVYECKDTGFQFYYPLRLDGDSKFYEKISQNNWYYMDWKWEHQVVLDSLAVSDSVLEIGCGFGSFLNRLSAEGIVAHGLEINQKAVEKAKSKGLQVESTNLSEYSDSQQGKYDVVCMFQVLEHVSDLKPIITQSLNLLKPNGRLIISVPNNDSFIGFDNRNCLNMPPHHTGLWNQAAFEKLDRFFKMSLLKIILEPLADYHLDWYLGVKSKNSKYLGLLIQKFPKLSKFLTNIFRKHIKGHSIIAIYTKK